MKKTKPSTVLQVLPALETGGVERGTVEIAAALQREGFMALVASFGGRYEKTLQKLGVTHSKLPLHSKNPVTIYRNAARLQTLIEQRGIDLIHARSRAPAWSAWLAARHTGIPFVTTFHGVYRLRGPFKKHYNSVMARGDRVIAVSQFVADHIASHYAMESERLRLIHRGADMAVFNPAAVKEDRKRELVRHWDAEGNSKPILLVPSRLTRWKGQDFCIKALARLARHNFFCVLLGAPEKHPRFVEELKALIARYALQDCVRIVGETPYMAEAYALAQFVIVPSLEPEAFGRAPVEAQAMGCPVITTRHGGACETVLENQTGWLVRPHDEQALAETIEKALTLDKQSYTTLAQNAIRNVQAHFSVDAMQRKTLAVYRELLPGI